MKNLYDHLFKYGFRIGKSAKNRLNNMSEPKLVHFLEEYLSIASNRPIVAPAALGATDLYPDSRSPFSMDVIKQLSLYAHRIYVHDEIALIAREWASIDTITYVLAAKEHTER